MSWTANEVKILCEAAEAAFPPTEPLLGTTDDDVGTLRAIDDALRKVAVACADEVVLIAVPLAVYDELFGDMLEEVADRCPEGCRRFEYCGSEGHDLGPHLVYRGFGGHPYPILPSPRAGKRSRSGVYSSGDLLVALDFEELSR